MNTYIILVDMKPPVGQRGWHIRGTSIEDAVSRLEKSNSIKRENMTGVVKVAEATGLHNPLYRSRLKTSIVFVDSNGREHTELSTHFTDVDREGL